MNPIARRQTNARMSQVVIHASIIHLAGQVARGFEDTAMSVTEQTTRILQQIDELLTLAGSDKTKLLNAQIWLADIGDFARMNEVWEAWMPLGHAPARSTCAVQLAHPALRVEITVCAAAPE